jgi:tetratricopeptide (TPR) repeat protein
VVEFYDQGREGDEMKRRFWELRYISVVLAFLVLVITVSCASKEEKKAKHSERAKQYIEKNEFRKAVIELKNVVQIDPNDDAAYFELGETHLKLKEVKEAFQAFSRAASVNPNNLGAQLKVGQMLLLGRQTEEAKKKVDLILQKTPNNIEALSLLSGVQLQERDLDAAIKTLEKAASLDPSNFNTQLSLARSFAQKGEVERAQTAYAKAIAIDPASNVPYVELSHIYASRGQLDKAEEELKKMIKATGSNPRNLSTLALFYESTKKYEEAEKTYLQAVEAAPKEDTGPLMGLSAYYSRTKSYDKALATVQRAAEIKKDDLNIQVSMAEIQLDFNRLKDAGATVDRVLEKDKGHVWANLLRGRLYLIETDPASALDRFNLVVRENPRGPMGYYFRALAQIRQGKSKLAEGDLIKAIDLDPRFYEARLILAEFYLRDRNKDLARQQIEASLRAAPEDRRVLMLQGNLKILDQDFKGAENIFKDVAQRSPEFAPVHVQLGLLYNLSKRRSDALNSFQKALQLSPEQTDALGFLVAIYVADKKFEEALQVCSKHKEKVQDNALSLGSIAYLEGNIFLAKGDANKAKERFKKSIEIEPSTLAAYVALARIYVGEKKYDEAISEYETILSKNPNYFPGYMAIGTIYDQKGEGQKAEANYRKALAIKKDFAPAANNLAWSLAERGGNIDEALSYAQIAKEHMPNSPFVMDTLGWIYYLKGTYLNAIAEFQDSLARDPNNSVVNYHMGLALHKSNEPAKAKDYIRKALEIDPNFKGAEEAQKILKQLQS